MFAIVHEGEKALLNLAADDLGFPLSVEQGGGDFKVFVHLSRYAPQEIFAALRELTPSFQTVKGNTIRVEAANPLKLTPLFDRHFLKMQPIQTRNGHEPGREEVVAFLERNANLKTRAITEGYGGFGLDDDESIEPEALFIGDGELPNEVRLRFGLYCEEHRCEERIRLCHILRAETREDLARYTKASGTTELNTRKATWNRPDDYEALTQLYDSMVEQVHGAVMEADACIPEKRDRWLPLIPAWHKVFVMDTVFRRSRVKNG